MREQQTHKACRARADALTGLANEQRNDARNDKVNASLLYAASRFTACVVASAAQRAAEMRNDKDEATRYFTQESSAMLVENIDDPIGNYQDCIQRFRQS
jgi:aspartate/tyrosine/aromatic aminotransferase